ncbi:MAG TPA: SPOR domain-containing protein [Terriglobia bacterium]|nr:SPOR domain-containing protein [Terriglobia bacterium]
MADGEYSDREERGLSARQLVMLFLGIVTVCGVFFAAGFLVGYNERTSKELPPAEQIEPSSAIPPTVNSPSKSQDQPVASASTPAETAPKTETIEPTPIAPAPVRQAGPPKPRETAPAPARRAAPPEATGGRYVLQVAASSNRLDADAVARALKGRGLPAFVVTPQQAGVNDGLYRVQIGPYPSREAAEAMKPRLEREGFKNPFIKH